VSSSSSAATRPSDRRYARAIGPHQRQVRRHELIEDVGKRIDGRIPDEQPGPRRPSIELEQVGERDLRVGRGLVELRRMGGEPGRHRGAGDAARSAATASISRRIALHLHRSASSS
jgi:hypothetical protein